MSPTRYQKIGEIFRAAQELSPDKQSDFLAQQCGDDAELRSEVKSLLAAAENLNGFIESPALEVVCELLASEPEDATTLAQPGDTIGGYQNISLLGKGGMSEVWLAKDERQNREVALKLLSANQLPHNQDRLQRFAQEARAVSGLKHPNIIEMFEIGQAAGWQFIAAEYVAGKTLRQRLKENDLTAREAIEIAAQIAAALAAAHSAGIIHRDIKPENVIIRTDGTVKVLDFGLARFTRKSSLDDKLKSITKPGLVMGTIGYMSPEQARGLKVDERTDLFSLGIVAHEMLTGNNPFEGNNEIEVIAAIFNSEPVPLPKHLPNELQIIVARALKKDRLERYQTATEMFADLRRLVKSFGELHDKTRSSKIRRSFKTNVLFYLWNLFSTFRRQKS